MAAHYENKEVEEFYEALTTALQESKSQYKIVLVDFNAKVGKHRLNESKVLKYRLKTKNGRGTRLVQFAKS